MRASDVHFEVLVFEVSYFIVINFMSKNYFSEYFPPKMSSIWFTFHLMNTFFNEHSSVSLGS